MSQTQNGILRLPNELLLLILEHARPEGFENLMLTCKRFYNAGTPLIQDHNTCKHWFEGWEGWQLLTGFDWRSVQNPKEYIQLFLPERFFQKVANLPLHLQKVALLYPKSAYALGWHQIDAAALVKDINRMLWMRTQLLDLLNTHHKTLFQIHSKQSLENVLKGLETKINDESRDLYGLMAILALLVLPNLRYLALQDTTGNSELKIHVLFELIKQDGGQKLFQYIHTAYILAGPALNLITIAPLLYLPRLKVLKVMGIVHYNRQMIAAPEQRGTLYKPLGFESDGAVSTLEQLILRDTIVSPEDFEEFLKPLEGLKSLVFESVFLVAEDERAVSEEEDDEDSEIESSDSESELSDIESMMDEGFHSDSCEPATATQVETSQGQHMSSITSEIEPATQNAAELTSPWPPIYKANDYLSIIKHTRGHSLQHLAMSLRRPYAQPFGADSLLITNFDGFQNLTHLEVDLRILKHCDKIVRPGQAFPHQLTSLDHVLPFTVEVFRLLMYVNDEQMIEELLGGLLREVQRFSRLRKIVLRVALDTSPMPWVSKVDRSGSEKLVEGFKAVGIEVVIEEVKCCSPIDPLEAWDD